MQAEEYQTMKKVKVVFVFQVPSFWPSWESLYEALEKDERFTIKLFWIDDVSAGDKAQMEHAEEFLKQRQIAYEIFSFENVMRFKPDYMIYQTPYDKGHRKIDAWTARFKREGIRIIYIPYGIEISDTPESRYKHFSLSVVLNAHAVYVLSNPIREEYKKHCINWPVVKALGLPRFDALRKRYFLEETLEHQIDGRKVILWKSHFPKIFMENGIKQQATPDLDEYLKFIEYIQEEQELFFIFMPHPKFSDDTIEPELREKAVEILRRLDTMPNVHIDRNDDYRVSLTNADAIIVDRSAVMVEAGAVGVPVLFMSNPKYTEPVPAPIQTLLNSYYHGIDAKKMVWFCSMVKNGIDEKEQIRHAAFEECVPYFDGKCADRIKEDIWKDSHQGMQMDMLYALDSCFRIALFGTGDIAAYCMDAVKKNPDKGIQITYFVDNSKKRQGKLYEGKPVIAPEKLSPTEIDYVVIASDKYYTDIYRQLAVEIGWSKEKIINFDQFLIFVEF